MVKRVDLESLNNHLKRMVHTHKISVLKHKALGLNVSWSLMLPDLIRFRILPLHKQRSPCPPTRPVRRIRPKRC